MNLKKLNQLIEDSGMDIDSFGFKVGKSKATIYNYLSGASKMDVSTLEIISKILNVPVSYFFDEEIQETNIIDIQNNELKEKYILRMERDVERLERENQELREAMEFYKKKVPTLNLKKFNPYMVEM